MEYYAHSIEGCRDGTRWQMLRAHLVEVAEPAGQSKAGSAVFAAAYAAGLVYDPGTYRWAEYQKHIRNQRQHMGLWHDEQVMPAMLDQAVSATVIAPSVLGRRVLPCWWGSEEGQMAYYAHTIAGARGFHGAQPLRRHLRGVAKLAQRLARDAAPDDRTLAAAAYVAGLLHDLGKYRDEFQAYLALGDRTRKGSPDTAHSVYGAAAAVCTDPTGMVTTPCDALAFAIAGHHAGLSDIDHLQSTLSRPVYDAIARCVELLERARTDRLPLSQFALPGPAPEGDDAASRAYEFSTRMLLSLLVDADRLDSERWERRHGAGKRWKRHAPRFDADTLLDRLHAARQDRATAHPTDVLGTLRNSIFDACLRAGRKDPCGFHTLTVPTGGGKTLSSMAFALSHAKARGLRRVIVVIPYLSIIEQNAKDYRDIFGAGQVLEHHSAVEIPDAAASPPQRDQKEPAQTSEAERATENWDVPIVVTTSVQFIETLFSAATKRARKLHNIARSVVVFDEVQTLPTHLLEPLLDVSRELRDKYGVSFLFCSATQPAFRKSANLKNGFRPDELTEIAPDPEGTYKALRRVDYVVQGNAQPWDWNALAASMAKAEAWPPQALTVLNLRRHAYEAWDALRRMLQADRRDDELSGVFHLSSAMCPAHRLDLLGLSASPPPDNIRARLRKGEACWVISTQLIEAGVDVDFPRVFRAMGPLDSIVQSAGRCNREGRLKGPDGKPRHGVVTVFCPANPGLPKGIYDRATRIAPGYLDPERLATDPHLFYSYFDELFQLVATDHQRRGQATIQQDRAAYRFRTVADKARVIADRTAAVIVPYGRGKELVEQIRTAGRFDRDTLRRLQRYTVNLRNGPKSDFATLQSMGALEPLLAERLDVPVLDESCYRKDVGVVIESRPAEDFIL